MNNWQQRTAGALVVVVAVVLVYAAGYQWGMAAFEGVPVSYAQAVQVVVESITTAGFGGHAPWSSTAMSLFVLAMNLTGMLLVFLAVPLFVVPLVREALKAHPPARAAMSGHFIICTFSPRGAAFAAGLASRGRDHVFVEPNPETARSLYDDGHAVIEGDPELTRTLENANLSEAAGVVADADDDANASIALSVRELNADVRLATLVEDPAAASYHRLAGADAVLSPRQLLGRSLARQVPTVLTRRAASEDAAEGGIALGDHVALFEIKIEPGSVLFGKSVREARLRERFGFDAIGAWKRGRFTSPVAPDAQLEAGTRLFVAGPPGQRQALQQEGAAAVRSFGERPVVVAGHGRAGRAAASTLAEADARTVVLDRDEKEGVDVVGDARDPETLEEAGLPEAKAAIIAVDDDTTAIAATLVMRDVNPALYLIVRADREADEQKLYRAGADYVQSLATVSGRMMRSTMLEDERVFAPETQIEIARLPAGALAGQTLAGARVRSRTGCTVLATMRDGGALPEMDPDAFRFAEGDDVLVAGTSEQVQQFEAAYVR
jgi:Trk K+ transport system NAD-binding subunit